MFGLALGTAIVILALMYPLFKKKPMKILYIIRGIPGSGKSTLADKMAIDAKTNYSENDNFLYNEKGEYEWSQERLSRAIDMTYDEVYLKVLRGDPVIITTGVYARWRAMRDFVELGQKNDYKIHVIECKGEYQNIHGVTAERLDEMKRKFIPNSGLPQINITYSIYHP